MCSEQYRSKWLKKVQPPTDSDKGQGSQAWKLQKFCVDLGMDSVSGAVIMGDIWADNELHDGVDHFLYLFEHMVLKGTSEAVVESIGNIVDRHAIAARHLSVEKYMQEAFTHWNGPNLHDADSVIREALDRYFHPKTWHFTYRTERLDRFGKHKVSAVVDRQLGQPSKLQFMV